ncbi:hypothetical protein [Actinoplanes sp. NPDC051411]|uniref:hypothetical protein n=1 Tax=Actinoplanes sp. NPDC051411 TaxID=3155522 RepID=UPI003424B457
MTAHGLAGVADAGAFLARLTRLDPAAPVRLKASGGRTALWARLPWEALVTREVASLGEGPGDATVSAAELLSVLAKGGDSLPALRDEQWRWPLPPASAVTIESISGAELARLAAAAAGTLREVAAGALGDRAIGQRAVRDALLDHVALTVTPSAGDPVEVSQRLVQAVSRMGFLGPAGVDTPETRVRTAGRWVGLSAPYGVAWLQKVGKLTVVPIGIHPIG